MGGEMRGHGEMGGNGGWKVGGMKGIGLDGWRGRSG